jgi:hypothetical protein
MSQSQLGQLSDQLDHSRGLFTDRSLDMAQPQHPTREAVALSARRASAQAIPLALLKAPGSSEVPAEDKQNKPVMRPPGHTVGVQAALRTPNGTACPNYIFCHEQSANVNPWAQLNEVHLRGKTFTVGDATAPWRSPDTNLS